MIVTTSIPAKVTCTTMTMSLTIKTTSGADNMVIIVTTLCEKIVIIIQLYMFCNHTWQSAQLKVLCTKISKVNLSVFIYRQFHEDFSLIIGTNTAA